MVCQIVALSDTDAEWSKSIGLSVDLSAKGLGIRTGRYALILENLVVKHVLVRSGSTSQNLSHITSGRTCPERRDGERC